MLQKDAQLLAGFILSDPERYFAYMDNWGLDLTEATVIIEDMIRVAAGGRSACVEPFSGFIGE